MSHAHIYAATGNGTFDLMQTSPIDNDAGDSLLKLLPPTAPSIALTLSDFFTPYNVFGFYGDEGYGLCLNDQDLSSGGVLLPLGFTYTSSNNNCSGGCSVAITADKQSNLYIANQADLGKFTASSSCASSTNNIQCVTTPGIPSNDSTQGYWASPAYWRYTPDGVNYSYMLYYSATMQSVTAKVKPEAINAYQLQTSGSPGPIPSATPYASTSTLFCDYSPTPSLSSNGTAMPKSGIVWAIEQNQNKDNPGGSGPDCAPNNGLNVIPHAALHAFCAMAGAPTGPCHAALTEIYTSRQLSQNLPGLAHAFPTPTIFNGQVYMGTDKEIDVFGLCINGQNGRCLQ
jgi:hypothetical protein